MSPLVVHVIHQLAVGGLENGLVNLINRTPEGRYRHAVVALTDYTNFRGRIQRADVPVIALHKRPGHDLGAYVRLWRELRRMRPSVVHTRNFPTLEYVVLAAFAGVPARIHGEHGRDVDDLDGTRVARNQLRKIIKPLTHCYTAVSADLANWLVQTVGIPQRGVEHIYNGVDSEVFHPRIGPRPPVGPAGFAPPGTVVIGTVGRMKTVKDQSTLVKAFLHLRATQPAARDRVRLVMVGDGPSRADAQRLLREAGAEGLAWLPGERADIPELMRGFDVFVLPSLREGISNTILEAMATGLPVVATRTGGNVELVMDGRTGLLVPVADPEAMAAALQTYLNDDERVTRHGRAARERVEACFSIDAMVDRYLAVYDRALNGTS